MIAGILCVITGILGFLTGKCRQSKLSCIFSLPYIILALVSGILLLAVAGLASGQATDQLLEQACQAPVDGTTLELKVKQEYGKLVDKLMCAPEVCPCPADVDVVKIWGEIPEEELRSFDRIANFGQYKPEEFEKIARTGPYDADVIVFSYEATGSVRTYKECYDKGLKPTFDAEKGKAEADKDPKLAETMKMVDKFFDAGGYELLADFEEKYNCASICSVPLFYLTKDVKEG